MVEKFTGKHGTVKLLHMIFSSLVLSERKNTKTDTEQQNLNAGIAKSCSGVKTQSPTGNARFRCSLRVFAFKQQSLTASAVLLSKCGKNPRSDTGSTELRQHRQIVDENCFSIRPEDPRILYG